MRERTCRGKTGGSDMRTHAPHQLRCSTCCLRVSVCMCVHVCDTFNRITEKRKKALFKRWIGLVTLSQTGTHCPACARYTSDLLISGVFLRVSAVCVRVCVEAFSIHPIQNVSSVIQINLSVASAHKNGLFICAYWPTDALYERVTRCMPKLHAVTITVRLMCKVVWYKRVGGQCL